MLARTILLLTIAVTAAVARPTGVNLLSNNGLTSGSSAVKDAHTADSGPSLNVLSGNTVPTTYGNAGSDGDVHHTRVGTVGRTPSNSPVENVATVPEKAAAVPITALEGVTSIPKSLAVDPASPVDAADTEESATEDDNELSKRQGADTQGLVDALLKSVDNLLTSLLGPGVTVGSGTGLNLRRQEVPGVVAESVVSALAQIARK